MTKRPTVHVTQVGGCKRKKYHEIMDKGKGMPPHFYGVKGTMCHKVIEKSIEKIKSSEPVEIDITYPNLLDTSKGRNKKVSKEVYQACLPEVESLMTKTDVWLETQEDDLNEFTSEETLEVVLDECVIKGTPDLYSNSTLIDFKSGKPVMRKEYIRQAAAYKWMLKRKKDIDITECHIIFFGGDEPVDKVIPALKLEEGLKQFFTDLREHLCTGRLVREGGVKDKYQFKCSNDFMCTMCNFRNICSGI